MRERLNVANIVDNLWRLQTQMSGEGEESDRVVDNTVAWARQSETGGRGDGARQLGWQRQKQTSHSASQS